MKLKMAPVTLNGNDGTIHILRNGHGIPEISADTVTDLMHGLGWVHANDRQLQTLLTRILLQGRAAELLKADDDLIALTHPACFHGLDGITLQDKNSIHPAFRDQQPPSIAQMQIFRMV